MSARPKLELVGLAKAFNDGSVPAVDGIDLAVEAGETVALLGSSGCGKSTTLNMIVGLERPTAGDILIDGQSILGRPIGQRDVGLVFQDYAIFTHMTVRQNLEFGLAVKKVSKGERTRAVQDVADLLGIRDKLSARAADLGGSELQRVAIGRTLVTRPSILLLDEPLSNLEAAARLAMRRELRRLQKEVGLTIIYVTHDQVEALSLADRIAVMSAGKIQQVQKASLICERPDNTFVAGFLGSPPMNLLRGTLQQTLAGTAFDCNGVTIALPRLSASEELIVVLGLRPEALRFVPPSEGSLDGKVLQVEPRGSEAVATFASRGFRLKVLTSAVDRPREGQDVAVMIAPDAPVLFSGETGRRISA